MASLLALGAIGLVLLTGNYLPTSQALFLFAVAGILALMHAVSYAVNRFKERIEAAMRTCAEPKSDSESDERRL
jgi:hypothetical protein